ncbi:MAG: hypothetical protein NZ902_02125 [Acidilobaceae archaeon]|nr:hypothetical protein [Acidilobaceae archaeon]MCX8165619.1 hypothetical protein [Acidilobaceae archaeon]MDW7974046.1 hypothetical protein [Sulfolobales archaeon]
MAFIVAKKVLITFSIAIIGSALVLLGGRIDNPVTILGLLLVLFSPIISYFIVLRDLKRLPPKESSDKAQQSS